MSGSVPTWLTEWLGVPAGAGDEGASWRIDLAWPWPPWATVLLLLAAITWVAFCYVHESSTAGTRVRALLATLRLAAVALLLVMLTQATLTLGRTGPPTMALVVDRSASMSITDRYDDANLARLRERCSAASLGEPTRLNLAKLLLLEPDTEGSLLELLTENYSLQTFFVDDGIQRMSDGEASNLAADVRGLATNGSGSGATRLGDAVRQVADDTRGASPAGVVILSDGVVTAGVSLADAAEEARTRGVPLFVVGLGSDSPTRDIELTSVLVDDAVFIDDLVAINVEVKATGLEGETARVVLRREGESQPLAERSVTLGSDGVPQTVFLTHRPTAAGELAYTIEVEPRDEETNRDNNRQRRIVSVRDEKIRVLLMFGYPDYEFRFIKSLLERDSTVDLATFLQDADPEFVEQDRTAVRALPVLREELFQYDVLIIGDVDPRLTPRSLWPEVRAFVAEKGGGVVFVAGPRFLPWLYGDVPDVAALVPIGIDALASAGDVVPDDVARGFQVRPTPLGLRLPPLQLGDTPSVTEQIWRELAPLYWMVEVERLKPAAQVLAEHPTHTTRNGRRLPVIVSQYFGAGKVWFHATDSTWRWRIGVGDTYFARYWVQTIRYLARGKLAGGSGAEISTDRREYQTGETVSVRLRFRDPRLSPADDQAMIIVDSPGRASRRVPLRRSVTADGVFDAELADLRPGQYEILLTEPTVPGAVPTGQFTVVTPVGEMTRTRMDRAALAAAAETTHGEFYTIADADRLANELPRGRRVPIANLAPLSLWNRWWLLVPFLALLIAEWILRKRVGML